MAAIENAELNGNANGNVLAVHRALWRLADGAEVCATMKQVASASGLGDHAVRDSLRSLVESGQIIPAGKRGKTSVFRLSPSTPGAEPPSRRDSPQGGSSSTNGRSTAHSISPQSEEDREHFDNWVWTPEKLADYAARARALALRYAGADEVAAEVEDAGPGECADCHYDATRRGRYGSVVVCRPCVARRHAVAMRLASRARGRELREWVGA